MGFLGQHNMAKKLVMDGRAIAWYYTRRGNFPVDLITAIAFFSQVQACSPTHCHALVATSTSMQRALPCASFQTCLAGRAFKCRVQKMLMVESGVHGAVHMGCSGRMHACMAAVRNRQGAGPRALIYSPFAPC